MIGILGAATYFPRTVEVQDSPLLLDDGERQNGVHSVPVSHDLAAPEMAVLAARSALTRADLDPLDALMNLHCMVFHQGHLRWSPAHYIASELGLPRTSTPIGISMLCSAGPLALDLAASKLDGRPDHEFGLVTTAERYGSPGWDRWETHPDIAYGDGASAILVGKSFETEYSITAVAQRTDSALEGIERGDRPFSSQPGQWPTGAENSAARDDFYAKHGRESLKLAAELCMSECLTAALDTAGLDPHDERIAFFVPPRLGPRLQHVMFGVAHTILDAPWRQLGRETGHMGGGDSLVSVAQIIEASLLEPGQIAVIAGGGGGFTWTCLVLERRNLSDVKDAT